MASGWTDSLSQVGLYYEGIVDSNDLGELLETHKKKTGTTYGTRTSSRREHCTLSNNPIEKLPRILWKYTTKGKTIHFDDTPFSVGEKRTLDCQYGKKYYKSREPTGKRLYLQGTRKQGCKAQIELTEYIIYPDFDISSEINSCGSEKAKRVFRECKLNELKELLRKGEEVKLSKKYFVHLPSEEVHHPCHPTGRQVGMAQRVHPAIIQKIHTLVIEGIMAPLEVQRHLKHYVNHYLCPNDLPDNMDRAYYPSLQDIRNHINIAKQNLKLSVLDQENAQLKAEEWKKASPEMNILFRPYSNEVEDEKFDQGIKLLWIHQEQWQQELLIKYGNTITMIDATYKTTKYDLPLFFVCVKTNSGYCVVAEFIIESEDASSIQEAIDVLKSWNPGWNPRFFMSDFSEAEMLAIKSSFPKTELYICDFHREQAWERWVKDHHHNLDASQAEQLLVLLRNCARASSPAQDENLSIDHYYQCALKVLKDSNIWKENDQVQHWMTSTWLPVAKHWARTYRDSSYHASVETNNGTEAMNRLMKYQCLPRQKKLTLSTVTIKLVEEFIPSLHYKYVFKNFKQTALNRVYNPSIVPLYLQGRPRGTILHCINRKASANKYVNTDISDIDVNAGIFTICHNDKAYTVNFGIDNGNPSCTCKDWASHHLPCKHFFCVFRFRDNWTWESLPMSYLTSEYLSVDHDAIVAYVNQGEPESSGVTLYEQELDNLYRPCAFTPQQSTQENDYKGDKEEDASVQNESVQALAKKVRVTLESIKCLTYDATDEQYGTLDQLHSGLQQLMSAFRKDLPHREGLLVRPEPQNRATVMYKKRKSKRISKLIRKASAGRKKMPSSFRNRIGARANEKKKKYFLTSHVSVTKSVATKSTAKKVSIGVKRKYRCGECEGCKSLKCQYCIDMKAYGGQGKKKQCCIKRRCQVIVGQKSSNNLSPKDEVATDEIQRSGQSIPDFLKDTGRILLPIKGDGNCLFRALSHQLTGCESNHLLIRSLLMRFENLNQSVFERRLTEINASTITEHICQLQKPSTWGTHIEIAAAATYFQLPVYYCQKFPNGQCNWQVVNPLNSSENFRYPNIDDTTAIKSLKHVELVYHAGSHYDSIVSDSTKEPCIDPPILVNEGVHLFETDIL